MPVIERLLPNGAHVAEVELASLVPSQPFVFIAPCAIPPAPAIGDHDELVRYCLPAERGDVSNLCLVRRSDRVVLNGHHRIVRLLAAGHETGLAVVVESMEQVERREAWVPSLSEASRSPLLVDLLSEVAVDCPVFV